MLTPVFFELAKTINQERVDEARKRSRGFCCTDDRRELEQSRNRSDQSVTPSATDSACCGC